MVEVQRVGTSSWIESLPDEVGLRIFERASQLGPWTKPKEQRTCVRGKSLCQMTMKSFQIQFAFADDGRHPGPALGSWNRNAVDAGMQDAFETAQLLRHLGRRHVLALPAK